MEDLKGLQIAYNQLELSRLKLLDIITTKIILQNQSTDSLDIVSVPGGQVQWDGKVLKFVLPDYIPSKNAVGELDWKLYKETRTHWQRMIFSLYKSLGVKLSFDKIHCHIACFLPHYAPWDVDNRVYKFVIDGLRSCRFIKDDSYKYLTLSLSGQYDPERPRTEIFVTENTNLDVHKILNSSFTEQY